MKLEGFSRELIVDAGVGGVVIRFTPSYKIPPWGPVLETNLVVYMGLSLTLGTAGPF